MTTPPPSDDDRRSPNVVECEALVDVVRDEFGRIAYSQKTHQKMVDRLNGRLLLEKRLAAMLLVVTTGGTIKGLVSDSRTADVLALVFSSLALLLTVYGLSRNRERQVEQHRLAAQALLLLREQYIHLIGDLHSRAISVEMGRIQRDALTKAAAHVYASAPDTDAASYKAAQRALKVDEEFTFSEREIDMMLPPALRRKPL